MKVSGPFVKLRILFKEDIEDCGWKEVPEVEDHFLETGAEVSIVWSVDGGVKCRTVSEEGEVLS